jgi:nitroreductase
MTATPLIDRLTAAVAPADAAVSFSPRDVAPEEQSALIAAARVAPSADNLQTWRFVAVRDADRRRRLAAALREPIAAAVAAAPLALVVCGVRTFISGARREQPFVLVDVPIALGHVLLQAAELGLAAAWTLDGFDEEALRAVVAIPDEGVRVVAVLAVGWPLNPPAASGSAA